MQDGYYILIVRYSPTTLRSVGAEGELTGRVDTANAQYAGRVERLIAVDTDQFIPVPCFIEIEYISLAAFVYFHW